MVEQRAMSAGQKEARRQTLLDATLDLFAIHDYEAVNVAEVAQRAGVAKGTVYLYFKSKEELFLTVYTQQLAAFFDDLDAGLDRAPADRSIATFMDLITACLERRPAFVRLVAILHTVLERNIDYATALAFRQMQKQRLAETGQRLESFLLFLKPGEGVGLLLKVQALIIGLVHLAEPAPVVRQVLDEPGMEILQLRLGEQLLESLKALLIGLSYEAKYTNERR